jgi:hypothetical protein
VSRKHRHDKHKDYPVARPAGGVATNGDYDPPAYPQPGLLTLSTKFGLVLIVFLSIGLGALILFGPPPKGHKVQLPWNDNSAAVAKVEKKDDAEKKSDSTEKAPEKSEKKAEKKEKAEDKKESEKATEKKSSDKTDKKSADKEKKSTDKEKMTEKKSADKEKMDKKSADKEKMTEKKSADKEKMTEKKPAEKEKEKMTEKKPAEKEKEKKPDEKEKEKAMEKKPAEKEAGNVVLFEKHVLPIFEKRCTSCHGAKEKESGLDVRTLKALEKGGDGGPAVVKGDVNKSIIWEKIESNDMPKGNTKLTDEEKDIIKKWIAGGAKTAAMAAK